MSVRKRRPKVVGFRKKSKQEDRANTNPEDTTQRPEKSRSRRIYDVIFEECYAKSRFMRPDMFVPYIDPEDIEEKEDGVFVIWFNCDPQHLHYLHFGSMANDVCARLRSGLHFIHKEKTEWGLKYSECVWVLQVGELNREYPFWRLFFMPEKKIKTDAPDKVPGPKKCSHARWEEFLQKNYGRTLLSVAQELGYSEQNLDILGCKADDAAQKKCVYLKYKSLFDSFLKDEWNKALVDGRNVLDYFKDLIASWIGEDLLVRALNEYGFNANLANADSDRVIKTSRGKVTGEPDIKIEYNGAVRYLELMDALSPIERYGHFDLRRSKAKNQFNRKTIFLLHGLADGKYVLIDFMRDNVVVAYNYPNPRFGNKPCSVLRFDDNGIKMQEMSLLWESIKGIMENDKPEPEGHFLKMVDYQTGKEEVLRNQGSTDEGSPAEETSPEVNDSDSSRKNLEEKDDSEKTEPPPQMPEMDTPQKSVVLEEESESDEDKENGESSEDSVVEEDDEGNAIEYTAEQWAALSEGF